MDKKMLDKLKFHLRAFLNNRFYNSDGLYTIHNADFRNHHAFINAYKEGANTGSWGENPNIQWRAHVILWAAEQVKNIEGDFVECGVNKGGFCKAILSYIDFNSLGKTFWLFDSFEGNFNYSILTENESSKIKSKSYNYIENGDYSSQIIDQFKYDNVKVIKGLVPETLTKFNNNKVSFLSIDMNSSTPEIEALIFFWDKLSKGAIIVLDDYAYYSHEDQYKSINEYCYSKNISILSLPTGQGLIIK